MNTNLEAGFLIEDFCKATGRNDRTDLGDFRNWINADHERATTWAELRGIHECDDAGLIGMAMADPKLGWRADIYAEWRAALDAELTPRPDAEIEGKPS